MSKIYWVCIACNELNLDDDELTATPMCGNCSVTYLWDELEEWPGPPPRKGIDDG